MNDALTQWNDNDPAPFVNDQHVFLLNSANPSYPNDVYYHYNPISEHGSFDWLQPRINVINGGA